jgi:NitT/TauT family transport system substrate-binding protein
MAPDIVSRRRAWIARGPVFGTSVCLAALLFAGGCRRQDSTAPGAAATPSVVHFALPYRPDVQFAPLYVAQERGYFRDAGLDVQFDYGDESQQVRQVAAGERQAMIAGGDQVILARSAGIPVKYVMTWFQRFPVAVFSTHPDITRPQDLVGKTVGLPAPGGTSYLGWQLLLLASGIAPESVHTEVIGFQQRQAVEQGRVDAAVGYANNEPVQLRADGKPVSVIEVADAFNLVANGLVVGDSFLAEYPDTVRGLATAIQRGVADTLKDPDSAFATTLKVVPEAGDAAVRDVQRQVLQASLRFWRSDQPGHIDTRAWDQSQQYMARLGLIPRAMPVGELVAPILPEDAASNTPAK